MFTPISNQILYELVKYRDMFGLSNRQMCDYLRKQYQIEMSPSGLRKKLLKLEYSR